MCFHLFSVLLFFLTSSRALMASLSPLSSSLSLQKVRPLSAPTDLELTLIRSPLFCDPISLFLFRPLRTLCTCLFSDFSSSYITLPTPLSPSQTHFFISTPTLSTYWCNGADSEEIKRSGKKKRKMSACTCTVSLCHSTRLHFVTPSSSFFQLYFREHKFSATGYKFPLQHATGCHFVLICC